MKKLQTAIAILSISAVALAAVLSAKWANQPQNATTVTQTTTEITTEAPKTTAVSTTEAETETEKPTTPTTTEKPTEAKYEATSLTPSEFRKIGKVYGESYIFTWYSERVLPGGRLNIPGRHSDGNFVRDEDEYIVLASRDLPKGTVVETPVGTGKVYDECRSHGVIDIYTSW